MKAVFRAKFLGVALLFCSPALFAQDPYPSHPIKIIVPFAVGGGVQTLIEILRPAVTRELGQALVADYKPGAGGAVGTQFLLNSPPDGYTLLLHSSSLPAGQALNANQKFDANRDLKPVLNIAFSPFALVVSKNVPAKSVSELVAYVKANPGKVNWASAGIGGSTHFAGELMKQALGNIPIVHIPYKGTGAVITAITAGEVDVTMEFPNGFRQHVEAGSARILAVASRRRDPTMPDVPTFAEAGAAPVEIGAWLGLFGPAKMPDEIADKLQAAFARALKDPEVVARFQKVGYTAIGSTRAQLAEQVASDIVRYTALVKSANIKPE